MPLVPFERLPDDGRCWVFAARAPLDEVDTPRLLAAVDGFLMTWQAHGAPLTCAREFRDEHFLVIGVDVREADASGCSIDGLFHVLQQVGHGRILIPPGPHARRIQAPAASNVSSI